MKKSKGENVTHLAKQLTAVFVRSYYGKICCTFSKIRDGSLEFAIHERQGWTPHLGLEQGSDAHLERFWCDRRLRQAVGIR